MIRPEPVLPPGPTDPWAGVVNAADIAETERKRGLPSLEWVRGFQAAREQAARMVETGVVSCGGHFTDYRTNVVAAAIRVMQPEPGA